MPGFLETFTKTGHAMKTERKRRESPTEPNCRQNPHIIKNITAYKLISISLSLISLGAGDSRLAPYVCILITS